MTFSDSCMECGRPKGDHPLMILKQGEMSYSRHSEDGTVYVQGNEVRVILSGRSWKYEYCSEFIETKQLELF